MGTLRTSWSFKLKELQGVSLENRLSLDLSLFPVATDTVRRGLYLREIGIVVAGNSDTIGIGPIVPPEQITIPCLNLST